MRFKLYTLVTRLLIRRNSDWKNNSPAKVKNTIWFHAASSGELEILIPIIEAAVSEGRSAGVSIFSKSAESWLKKLPSQLLYRGFSPSEGEWQEMLQHFGVSEVITSKYEAWPGLWKAASLLKIKISVICASPRSSLLWAKRILKSFGIALPKLRFFVLEQESIPQLQTLFPDSECILGVDPRWLRVFQRSENANHHEAFQKWRMKHIHSPKPYWVIGSAWKEDMEFLSRAIESYPGTVWVVPHSLKESPDPSVFSPYPNCILVNEMGLLVELYSIADRAWVGGGFGEGIHSTLEPSVYSIPVASGPKNVEKFFETKELIQKHVLTICETPENIQKWVETSSQIKDFSLKLKLEMIHQMIRTVLK